MSSYQVAAICFALVSGAVACGASDETETRSPSSTTPPAAVDAAIEDARDAAHVTSDARVDDVTASRSCHVASASMCYEGVSSCAAPGGALVSACPPDRVGGCIYAGTAVIVWYYAPRTKAGVRDACGSPGDQFVEP